MEWISVKDRLPKTREHVLAYSENYNGTSPFVAFYDLYWRDPDFEGSFDSIEGITYWTPFTAPPK